MHDLIAAPTIHGGAESLPSQSPEHLTPRTPFTGCPAGHTFFHADPFGKASIEWARSPLMRAFPAVRMRPANRGPVGGLSADTPDRLARDARDGVEAAVGMKRRELVVRGRDRDKEVDRTRALVPASVSELALEVRTVVPR